MKIRITFLLLLIGSPLFSQDIIDTIAIETCRCLENVTFSKDQEQMNMQLGLCLIESAEPYKSELKEFYNIDLNRIAGRDGKKIGEMVGVKMVVYCPDVFLRITGADTVAEEEIETLTMTGIIDNIEPGQFYTVTLIDENQRRYKLLWLFDFDESYTLLGAIENAGKRRIEISYIETELFDATLNEARSFRVIAAIRWLE